MYEVEKVLTSTTKNHTKTIKEMQATKIKALES